MAQDRKESTAPPQAPSPGPTAPASPMARARQDSGGASQPATQVSKSVVTLACSDWLSLVKYLIQKTNNQVLTTNCFSQVRQEPLFHSVPPRPQRLLHSEAYIKYIEGLNKDSRSMCNWDRQLNVTQEVRKNKIKNSSITFLKRY